MSKLVSPVLLLTLALLTSCGSNKVLILQQGSVQLSDNQATTTFNKPGEKIPLSNGQLVKTGAQSRVSIRFTDNKDEVYLYADTSLSIDERTDSLKLVDLKRGKARVYVEKRSRKRRLKVKTAHAVIGVKGTEFIVNAQNTVTNLLTLKGTVTLANIMEPEALVEVNESQISRVKVGLRPTKPKKIDAQLIEEILNNDKTDVFRRVRFGESLGVIQTSTNLVNVKTYVGNAGVVLIWDPVPETKEYKIYWSIYRQNFDKKAKIVKISQNFLIHKDLENGVPYYYQIVSTNSKGEEKLSKLVSATPRDWYNNLSLIRKRLIAQGKITP